MLLKLTRYGLVISDLRMPVMNGYQPNGLLMRASIRAFLIVVILYTCDNYF